MAMARKHGWLKNPRVYSASSIKTFLNCPLQAFYDKLRFPKINVPTHAEYVRGNILHALMPGFYREGGTPKYSPYSQKKVELLLREENHGILKELSGNLANKKFMMMNKEKKMNALMRYLAERQYDKKSLRISDNDGVKRCKTLIFGEPFANTAWGRFRMVLEKGRYGNKEIDISRNKRLEEENGEKEVIGKLCGEIQKIAKRVYKTYYFSKPPVFAEKAIRFSVIANNILLNYIAKLDEIRYPLTIRDHKSDFWLPEADSLSLNNDIQFSLYAIALSVGCSNDWEFAIKCGATKEDFEKLQKDRLYLLDKIKIEHHHMRTGEITDIRKKTKKDFDKIIKTTLEIEKKIMEYKMGDNHFFEIFDSRWGIDRHMGNVKECERCDYRRIHEEDQEKYESGEISYNPDESQIMLPGFVYPEKKKDEQLMLRFPAKKRLESAVKIA